jgi:transketolase
METYAQAHPELAAELRRRLAGELPADFAARADAYIARCQADGETIASRKASQNTLNAFGPLVPEFMGGSADLAGSNLTLWSGSKGLNAGDASGNYIYYGVREFGMSAIMNGIALHGGFIPYGATFLIFMEYARNAVRMAALMKLRTVFVYTHDSIGLGEDGPTHQAVEHTASLRLIPNLDVWRPCDTAETAVAWVAALERAHGPTALVLTRQNVPFQPRDEAQVADVRRGGYVLADWDAGAARRVVLVATGSEVALAVAARKALAGDGIAARVVSLPCTSAFDRQDAAYRASVLPAGVPRVAVEAGVTAGWRAYVGAADDPRAAVVGIDTFGESAPAGVLFRHFGITAEAVAAAARRVVAAAG